MEQAVGGWRKGPWTPQEDKLLIQYITDYGEGRWSSVSKCTGLKRSGKSCRLRWVNYLRPGLKKGHLTPQEEGIIIELHALWGNKWSTIARYLPGRTDNEIKNYWRTHFKTKKQEKRKIFLKQQQQESETGSDASASASASVYEMSESPRPQVQNSKEDEAIAIPSIDDDEFWSKVYEESAASEFIPMDCYLWDGLWNLDCDNGVQNVCSKMGMGGDQNQAYYNPFQGDAVGDFLL